MGLEKFCLSWNDYESNLSVAFRDLREEKEFFDVTLACEDEQIQGHKVILSSCSLFFGNILKKNQHSHPLLYLKGVKFCHLKSILDFMYQGKVNVEQVMLDSFLATAQELKVKGLTHSGTQQPLVDEKPTFPVEVSAGLDVSQEVFMSGDSATIQRNMGKEVNATEPGHLKLYKPEVIVEEQNIGEESFDDYGGANDSSLVDMEGNQGLADLDSLIEEHMTKVKDHSQGKPMWTCNDCGKFSRLKNDISKHVESFHITHPGLVCNLCERVLKTRDTLKLHMKSKHRDAQRLDD